MNETTDRIPFRPRDFFDRRSYYWQTRQWHYLKQGLPAIIISCVILIPILLAGFVSSDKAERYRVAFNRAVNTQNYETAYLFRQKLESISGEQAEHAEFRFNCALADIGRGQVKMGVELMRQLAPSDSLGYGPAHLWLAKKQISENPSISGPNGTQIVHHLKGALQSDPKNQTVHLALGHYYHHNGNQAKAVEHLGIAVEGQPQLHFVLANLHESLGDQELSKKHFRLATESMLQAIADQPQNLETRINLSVAYNKLGNFSEAVRTLVVALEETEDEAKRAEIINLLSTLYLAESDRIRKESKPDSPHYATSLMLLSKALEFAPNNEDAINRIAEIAALDGMASDKAIETLKKLMVSGQMTAMAHVILGTASLQQGDNDKANLHFGQAYRLDPKMPTLLNNVAWMLAHQEAAQLPKALAVINQALDATKQDDPLLPAMLDTRGRIYVKMQRWQDALGDLEQALKTMPNNPGLHGALAEAYRGLGEMDLAKEHERLAGTEH